MPGRLLFARRWFVIAGLIAVGVAGCGGGSGGGTSVSSTQANETTHHPPAARGKQSAGGYRIFKRNSVVVSQPRDHHYNAGTCRNGTFGGDVGFRYPGSIRPGVGEPYVGPGETRDITNMWWASDCHTFTAVTAASDGHHPGDGLLVIQREHPGKEPCCPEGSQKEVNVPGGGLLEITKAPLGPSVETWAQKRGNIEFKSKARGQGGHRLHPPGGGISGTLHLMDDTVTLDQ